MSVIECNGLCFNYGPKQIYNGLNFNINKGEVVGLLGKNGVGKSTLINILMGNLEPKSGECLIFGKRASKLSVAQKAKIGLLYEGHICYDFLSIKDIEKFYAAFYKKQWRSELYYELIDKLNVSYSQKISTLSCGQRSQVVLGLIFAQDPEILILDDYSLGLDAGYRNLFIEYLLNFIKDKNKTVFMTTHIVNGLESVINKLIILQRNELSYIGGLDEFMQKFSGYELAKNFDTSEFDVKTTLELKDCKRVFGFFDDKINGKKLDLSLEEAFLGLVGRY